MTYKEFVRDRYKPGEIVPWWKGFVRYDPRADYTIVAPLLFNTLLSALYILWLSLKRPFWDAHYFYITQNKLREIRKLKT